MKQKWGGERERERERETDRQKEWEKENERETNTQRDRQTGNRQTVRQRLKCSFSAFLKRFHRSKLQEN